MQSLVRKLVLDDKPEVEALCATIWEGNDYVPSVFSNWVSGENTHMMGVFSDSQLVAICNLEIIRGTTVGWVEGLRVREGHRNQGHASRIVSEIVELARQKGLKTLRYATGSLNLESQAVARKTGFHLATSVGYLRIERPFPPHPRPSPSVVPLEVEPSRLLQFLEVSPDLIDVERVPISWSFESKDLQGLQRVSAKTKFRVVVEDTGIASGLYYSQKVHDNGEDRMTFHVFATDRAVFVDIMSRMIEEADASNADSAVFFLGPRVKEWSKSLGYADPEFDDRAFLLFERGL
ncbi:MAG: GNAT family N-acetyltransferase [Candidatus Thorarchaeota archaeon]|nr:GNAT family N-acetyltransferase [Candidatus Thorarchaeota archaeon]